MGTPIAVEGMGIRDEKPCLVRDNPQGFAEAMVKLHEDPVLWKKLSDAGVEHAKTNYSVEAIQKKLDLVCRSMISD